MSVTNKDIWPVVKELFLEQYRGNLRAEIEAQGNSLPEGADNRLQGLLKVIIDKLIQPLDDACVELQELLDIDAATGTRLDFIGKLANLKRLAGESDSDYKERITASFFSDNEGTPDYAIAMSARLSGDTAPQYMEEADCTFRVYTGPRNENAVDDGESFDYENEGEGALTGGADQLYARQVKNLAPAGVLGLVGAAIQLYDGSLLGDAQGRLILAVADDDNVERSMVLVDNNNVPIVTPQNVPIRAVTRGVVVPKVTIELDGQYYDGVRVKDLPDAQNDEGFFVRDSEAGGSVKADKMDQATLDELWDTTDPEPSPNDNNG